MSPCATVGDVIVCMPEHIYIRKIYRCPKCKVRRRFTGWESGVWYPMVFTCNTCGTRLCEGQRSKPNRKLAVKAQEHWRLAITHDQWREWHRKEVAS